MKKLILLTMVLGLLVAGEARADGAWVLWYNHNRWDIVGADVNL